MNSLSLPLEYYSFLFFLLFIYRTILKKKTQALRTWRKKKFSIDKSRWTLQAISISLKINKLGNCLFCWKKYGRRCRIALPTHPNHFQRWKWNATQTFIQFHWCVLSLIPNSRVIYYSEYILVGFGKRTQNISSCWHITFHSCSLIDKST